MAKTVIISGLSTGVTAAVSVPSSDTWLTASISNTTLTVSASALYSTTAGRTSTVTVTATDGATASLLVTQYKKSAIILSPLTLGFDAAGNSAPSPEPPSGTSPEPTEQPTDMP